MSTDVPRRGQTLTTLAELAALPSGSVLSDRHGLHITIEVLAGGRVVASALGHMRVEELTDDVISRRGPYHLIEHLQAPVAVGPRADSIITTGAQYEALPVGTVLRSTSGVAWVVEEDRELWGSNFSRVTSAEVPGFLSTWPLTVIWRPDSHTAAPTEVTPEQIAAAARHLLSTAWTYRIGAPEQHATNHYSPDCALCRPDYGDNAQRIVRAALEGLTASTNPAPAVPHSEVNH